MKKDKFVLFCCWIIGIVLLIKFVPKNKLRHAVVPFMFKQVITWLFGLIVVEKGLIKYPVREFKKAYKGSFSFEYFLYPVLCTLFNLYYPEKGSRLLKFAYLNIFSGIPTILEVFIKKYTNLIKYRKWQWYLSYSTMGITYYLSRMFYRWFFKVKDIAS